MRWKPGRRSTHLEDRRSLGGGGIAMGGGGALLVLVLLLARSCLSGGGGGGTDPSQVITDILQQFPTAEGGSPGDDPLTSGPDPDEDLVDFMSFVLDDVQGFWDGYFAGAGQNYPDADLVLFRNSVQSGCGAASSATGPFYCPADSKAYLDLGFFRELRDRFGAPGDFAQAYVLAHELGHHVQNVLGIETDRSNEQSVRLELQADCFAGVWAHSAFQRDLLSDGDLEEGTAAAASVGDDRIQETTSGRVDPESFTHGTAEQRVRWLRTGYRAGTIESCDTFTPAYSDL